MEAARTSETLVNFYQTTRCYNPEDSNLHTHRRENLKSYLHSFYLCIKHFEVSSKGLLRSAYFIKVNLISQNLYPKLHAKYLQYFNIIKCTLYPHFVSILQESYIE
jgi:hypothetical protein